MTKITINIVDVIGTGVHKRKLEGNIKELVITNEHKIIYTLWSQHNWLSVSTGSRVQKEVYQTQKHLGKNSLVLNLDRFFFL